MIKLAIGLIVSTLIILGFILSLAGSNGGMTQEDAIKQAQEFEYDGVCLQVITPARHIETGAKYDFPCSAIPEGWEVL